MNVTSENAILAMLDALFPRAHASLLHGRGDDCAELAPCGPLAVSCDLFLENIHFRRSYFTPEEIGAKALAVNLSDLAAAGAVPVGFSLALICPPDIEEHWVYRMFAGMGALARSVNIPLCGGDISIGPSLGLNITVFGRGVDGSVSPTPFLRRGAQEGDIVFALCAPDASVQQEGWLTAGLARAGLQALEEAGRSAQALFPQACKALLRPVPLLDAGQRLARLSAAEYAQDMNVVRCMDVSDGLARDLPRLAGEGVTSFLPVDSTDPGNTGTHGCMLDFSLSIVHPETIVFVEESLRTLGRVPLSTLKQQAALVNMPVEEAALLRHLMQGGDEYMLLCACEVRQWAKIADAFADGSCAVCFRLGIVEDLPGMRWHGQDISGVLQGAAFDHFKKG